MSSEIEWEEQLIQACQYNRIKVLEDFHASDDAAAPKTDPSYPSSSNIALTHTVKDWAGDTLLGIAVWHGHREVAEFLLSLGADVNARNSNLSTPLHRAAYQGDANMVQLLIEHHADVTARDRTGRRPADVADATTRKLLSTVHTMRVFEEGQALLEMERRRSASQRRHSAPLIEPLQQEDNMEVVMDRRRRAVNVVVRGATNSKCNGVYEPVDQHHDDWPIFSKRSRDRGLWLLYNDASTEWLVLSTDQVQGVTAIVPDYALLRLPQVPANFPELRVQGREGVVEANTRRSFFDWSSPVFLPSRAQVITEEEEMAEKANEALRSQHEVGRVMSTKLGAGGGTSGQRDLETALIGLGLSNTTAKGKQEKENLPKPGPDAHVEEAAEEVWSPASDEPMLNYSGNDEDKQEG